MQGRARGTGGRDLGRTEPSTGDRPEVPPSRRPEGNRGGPCLAVIGRACARGSVRRWRLADPANRAPPSWLFYPAIYAEGRRRTVSPVRLSRSFSYPSPCPSLDRSPCVFVGTGEDTLVSGSVEVAHVFTRGAPPVFTATRSALRRSRSIPRLRYDIGGSRFRSDTFSGSRCLL